MRCAGKGTCREPGGGSFPWVDVRSVERFDGRCDTVAGRPDAGAVGGWFPGAASRRIAIWSACDRGTA